MGELSWRAGLSAIFLAFFWSAAPALAEPGRPHDAVPASRETTPARAGPDPAAARRGAPPHDAVASEESRAEQAARSAKPPMDMVNEPVRGPSVEMAPVAQPRPQTPGQAARRPEDITLTVASWKNAYSAAQQRAWFMPFTEQTKHKLETVTHGNDLTRLSRAFVTAQGWDMVELDARTARRGCEGGWLSEIDPAELPASVEGDPARADYLPGALMPCASASAAWAAVVVHDARAESGGPERITDLFDLEGFPGKRAMPRQAEYVLELALMADGVPPSEVYDVLATPAGQDRAFARLSAVRHAIVWWDNAAKALAPFSPRAPEDADDVVMGLAFNGRVFTSAVRTRQWLRILWDGQIYSFNYWAIPASAPNAEAARRLLGFVSLPERQAHLTRWFPYGPPRRSALPLVGQHAEIDLDMAGFVPTMPQNMTHALRFNAAFWAEHGEQIRSRFAKWIALPTPRVPADQFVPPTPVRALRATFVTIE